MGKHTNEQPAEGMEALLPCPFCGEVPMRPCYAVNQGDKWGFVVCGCSAQGPEVRTQYDDSDNAPWHALADEAWNRRTLTASRGEVVATLHSDGYWTHPAGKDPFDRYGPRANTTKLDVFTTPTLDARVRELVKLVEAWGITESSDEPPSEFDLGYEQAIRECTDQLAAALAAMDQETE